MGRYTDPAITGLPLPGLTDEQRPSVILLCLEGLELPDTLQPRYHLPQAGPKSWVPLLPPQTQAP